VTRRDVVKRGAAALAALSAGSVLAGHEAEAATTRRPRHHTRPRRVAIIGAGAGGVAAAYLMGDAHDVDIFESRPKIGGHCDSRVTRYRGHRLTVDVGAQFFHPDTHPIYVTLLQQLGLYDPARPGADDTLEAPASLCIFPTRGGPPAFSSTNALATPRRALEFVKYIQLARQAVLSGIPWDTTLETWIRGLAVNRSFKHAVVSPWTTALIGSTRADALQASARSILETFALAFPADIAQPATTFNSTIGLQGNLQRMLDRVPSARLHLRTGVRSLRRQGGDWYLETPIGRLGPYHHVVLNAPPRAGRRLLRGARGFAHLVDLLDMYEYFDSRILIHTDPAYVQRDRANWAVYNAGVSGRQCEGSVWYGALHPALPSGDTIDVFKSWATRRATEPAHVLFERRFKHPHISRSTLRAARALRHLQGRRGLHFSGQFTTGFDSQESAVYSAMRVAEALAPDSRPLRSLKRRLAGQGLAGISYDL
jgi:predicted NAD/FAD-binding protein